jgi:predicted unusual protein kinase regulating ubiquinone biosynthesis (AarF/ABC1/UbiB family)
LRVQNEVQRAIQLRDIVTSLGPAYIKLGQALSIRPDILSPAAMNELQKLCDKVRPRPACTGRLRRLYAIIWSLMGESL